MKTTMIVFLGEKKMHCGTKRKKKGIGGKVKDGNKAARREYTNGGKAIKDAMKPCMPN